MNIDKVKVHQLNIAQVKIVQVNIAQVNFYQVKLEYMCFCCPDGWSSECRSSENRLYNVNQTSIASAPIRSVK